MRIDPLGIPVMRLGRVVGTVVSTQKNVKLVGAKLLLVQPLTADLQPSGHIMLAVDAAQAGEGDVVLVVVEGRAAVSALRRRGAPVDAAVVGIVDQVDIGDLRGASAVRSQRRHVRSTS